MSTPEIIWKLTSELEKGITSEVQVVYLLAGIRKLIERDKISDQYADLKFHCDWVLHSSLEGTAARAILKKFDAAHPFLRDGLELHQLPSELRAEIDRIFKMRSFEKELSRFLTSYHLPALTKNRPDGWPHFLHLYTKVIEDIPLAISVLGRRKKGKLATADSGPKHISHVAVQFDQALEPVEHAAGDHLLFRVTWTIHDKNGQSGSVFIINSFSP